MTVSFERDDWHSLYERLQIKPGLSLVRQRRLPRLEDCAWMNLETVVYGPVLSRRLGRSLGINLFPAHKVCSLDCPYCYCGLSGYHRLEGAESFQRALWTVEDLLAEVRHGFEAVRDRGEEIDYVTVSGNGEPTLHPQFPKIAHGIRDLVQEILPDRPTAILTNSSRLGHLEMLEALRQFDSRHFKLDVGDERAFLECSRPAPVRYPHLASDSFADIVHGLICESRGAGVYLSTAAIDSEDGRISNLASLRGSFLEVVQRIRPRAIYLYNIDYPSPKRSLRRLDADEMLELGSIIAKETSTAVEVLEAFESMREYIAPLGDPSKRSRTGRIEP